MNILRLLATITVITGFTPPAAAQIGDLVAAREALKQRIATLQTRLEHCGGPPACPERAVIQARLNHALKMGMLFGDVVPVPKPTAVMPTDSADYMSTRTFLAQEIGTGARDVVYSISENRAKLAVIDHCRAMNDLEYLQTMLTSSEQARVISGAGRAEAKTKVNACIRQYDPRAISANRRAAIEYCFHANNYLNNGMGRAEFDTCMNRHDILQAVCKQELELQVAYARRNYPGTPPAPQTCPGVQPNPGEVRAILAAPAPRTLAELPAPLLTPPEAPPLPAGPMGVVPPGTVLEASLTSRGIFLQSITGGGLIQARLDRPVEVGGDALFAVGTVIFLKARVIGPGNGPGTTEIGVSTDWARKLPDYERVQLTSEELVFTLKTGPGSTPGRDDNVPPDTKLRFVIKN